jgi:hypothetical protein
MYLPGISFFVQYTYVPLKLRYTLFSFWCENLITNDRGDVGTTFILASGI